MTPPDFPCSYEQRPPETATYSADCPAGAWRGRLDFRIWGKSTNLFLYFTDLARGEKWRLSVWHGDNYHPRKSGPNFKTEATEGDEFELETAHTKTGASSLISAAPLEPLAAAEMPKCG
jgi:hypothetical protein